MRLLRACLILCFLVFPVSSFGIDWEAQVVSSVGSTGNLIKDTSDIFDAYSTSTLSFDLYPVKGLQIGLRGEQTYYRETISISSVLGGIGLTFIPLPSNSRFALYLSGDLSGQLYHDEYSGFDNNIGEARASVGYRLNRRMTVRGGIAFRSTRYVNSSISYKRDLDFFLGGNISLPGANALDIEAGFSKTNFQHKDNIFFVDSIPPGWDFPWSYESWFLDFVGESESDLWLFYWSPRLSRSIGLKTGVNIVYSVQRFQNYDDEIVWGFTTQYLSPWASVWEGQHVMLNLKSFAVPRLILTAGAGYWDKRYLKTIEDDHFFYAEAKAEDNRRDWQSRVYFGIQMPLSVARGLFVEPAFTVDYIDNKSNKTLFNYSDFAFSAGVTFRL